MKERENEQLNTESSAKKDTFSHHGSILMSGTGMGSLYFSNGVELVVQNYLEATWTSSWSDPQSPLVVTLFNPIKTRLICSFNPENCEALSSLFPDCTYIISID